VHSAAQKRETLKSATAWDESGLMAVYGYGTIEVKIAWKKEKRM